MSTLIQFRVSGDDEADLLAAARQAGMRPVDYVRQSAKLAANRPETALERIEQRLVALEAKMDAPRTASVLDTGPSTLVKGLDVTDLILELRRETRAGVNAFLVLLDGEPLPDIPHSRTPSGQSDFQAG